MHFEIGDRPVLRLDQTHVAFEFLQRDFNYIPDNSDAALYRSDGAGLTVLRERGSGYLDVELVMSDGSRFSLSDIEDWCGVEMGGRQYPNDETLQRGLAVVAGYLAKYAAPLLRGDEDAIRDVLRVRKESAAAYNEHTRIDPIRARAKEAWSAKDYAEVTTLLGPIAGSLSPLERRRLAYASARAQRAAE